MAHQSPDPQRLVVPRLLGGLGNQLFQVATAQAYARQSNRTLKLPRRIKEGGRRRTYHDSLFHSVRTLGRFEGLWARSVHEEPAFSFAPIPDYASSQVELAGYFQSARYFEPRDVRDVLTPCAEVHERVSQVLRALREKAQERPLVAVHVRRGDYRYKSDYHPLLPAAYYEQALASFDSKVAIALFSDDLAACHRERLLPEAQVIPVDEAETVCLLVMAGCDHHIIANSSFSWWGAYLAAQRGGRVLAPSRWFGPLGPPDTRDLLPEHWEVVPCQ